MTTLDPQFLRAVVLTTSFKADDMLRCQAALLLMALRADSITACQLPGECTNGSPTMAGCATGSLISIGLLEVCGRAKSCRPEANGRKVNLLHIPDAKRSTVHTWLRTNGFTVPQESPQRELAL